MAREKMDLAEARRIARTFKLLVLMALGMIGIGTTYFHFAEDWSWIDSLYFCVVSLTTVGYGDITPESQGARLFTVFYLLIGIGIIAAFVNNLFKGVVARREIKSHKDDL